MGLRISFIAVIFTFKFFYPTKDLSKNYDLLVPDALKVEDTKILPGDQRYNPEVGTLTNINKKHRN